MVEDKKQALKKFVHDYSLVVIVFVGLIITLLILAGIRMLALISIGDLSNINPLITSGQNKLVVKDGTSEIVKIPIEEAAKNGDSEEKSENGGVGPETPKGSGSTGNKNGSQGGSGNNTPGGTTNPGGGNGGSGGTNPNPTPTPTPTPLPAFTASISDNVQHVDTYISESGFIFKKCKLKHKFTFTINAENAPGGTPAKAQWKWLDYQWGHVFDVPFAAGQTSNTVWFEWELDDYPGEKEVKLRLTSPNNEVETHRFRHQC